MKKFKGGKATGGIKPILYTAVFRATIHVFKDTPKKSTVIIFKAPVSAVMCTHYLIKAVENE